VTLKARLLALGRRRFVRNVAVVAGGTAVAQALGVAFSPIITRLYGPEAFGVLGVFAAMVAIAGPVMSLAYASAIVLPASDGDARTLIRLSLRIVYIMSMVSSVVFLGWHGLIARLLELQISSRYLLLVPVSLLLTGIAQILRQWLIRQHAFRSLSRTAVAVASTQGLLKTAIGLVAASAPALLVANATGDILNAALLWREAKRGRTVQPDGTVSNVSVPTPGQLGNVAATYRDFPMYRAPQMLLNSVTQNLPVILLAGVFGPVSVGFFALGRRVLALPAELVSQSVGTVFLPRIAEAARNSQSLRPLVVKGTLGLAAVGVLPFGAVILTGPSLFGLVFGPEWVPAGEYARWLSLWLYFGFINVPSIHAVPLLGLQGHFLVYEVISLLVRAAALGVGAWVLRSDVAAIGLFGVSGALLYAILIAWVVVRSGGSVRPSMTPATGRRDGLGDGSDS